MVNAPSLSISLEKESLQIRSHVYFQNRDFGSDFIFKVIMYEEFIMHILVQFMPTTSSLSSQRTGL